MIAADDDKNVYEFSTDARDSIGLRFGHCMYKGCSR